MALDVVPQPSEEERAVLARALGAAGIGDDATPEAYRGSWWRTAVREAVDRQQPLRRYARSPRSTRGATRA